jgi:hypothetical protein
MSAISDLYAYVKERVGLVSSIKHFDWWNENVQTDGENTPYQRPACFFELNTIIWDQSTIGTAKNESSGNPEQAGNAEFTLHIIYDKKDSGGIDKSEIDHLIYIDEVYRFVHFAPSKPFIEGRMQRLREDPVPVHKVLRDWPMVFAVRLFEIPQVDPEIVPVEPWTEEVIYISEEKPYTDPPSGITIDLQGK